MVGWRWRGFAGSLAGGGARGAARRSVRWARRAPGAACGWGGGGLRWARRAVGAACGGGRGVRLGRRAVSAVDRCTFFRRRMLMAVTCLIVHPYSFVRLGVSTSCTLTRHCWLAPAPALDFGSAGESRRALGQRPSAPWRRPGPAHTQNCMGLRSRSACRLR